MHLEQLEGANNRHITHDLPGRDACEEILQPLIEALEARDVEYGEYRNDTFTHRSYDWDAECTCGFTDWHEKHTIEHTYECFQTRVQRALRAAAPAGTDPLLTLKVDECERIVQQAREEHGLPREGGMLQCTCDHDQRLLQAAAQAGYPEGCHANCRLEQPNLEHPKSGLKLTWYKYPLRSAQANKRLTLQEWREIIQDCLASLANT